MSKDPSSSVFCDPEYSLHELRTRARVRLNALKRGDPDTLAYAQWIGRKRRWATPPEWQLHHALNLVASELGFRDWEHARHVLSGRAAAGENMGGLWYDYRCQLLLNHWFASYEEARDFHRLSPHHWLFPYARQYVVGDIEYVRTLGLDPATAVGSNIERDLVAGYGSIDWLALCGERLMATRARPLMIRHF